MKWIKSEVNVFFTALMFYTRLPCPRWVDHSADMLNKSTLYFPLIGWIVGGFTVLVFWASIHLLPLSVSILLSMITGILVTGAFHEDGWADVCDGFGGGWTRERILTIMKDSVIGAYGVVGMVLMLLMKYVLLWETGAVVSVPEMILVMISAHSTSRLMPITTMYLNEYVRENEDSKAKPVAKQLSISSLLVAMAFGLTPLIFFQNLMIALLLLPMIGMTLYLSYYFKKWIGGYTGDCLGAVQQVTEVVFYLSFMILWKYI